MMMGMEGDEGRHSQLVDAVLEASRSASTSIDLDDIEEIRSRLKSKGKIATAHDALQPQYVDVLELC